MRQLWIKVPSGQGEKILEQVQINEENHPFIIQAQDQKQAYDVVVMNISNLGVNDVIQQLEMHAQAEIIFSPQDVFPLTPSRSEVSSQVSQVSQRSPSEVWLNGLQSTGSWKSFLAYSIAASVVAWIGMYTNTSFLLVAAMLIAPFAGPAMNLAMATATGDQSLLVRNLGRYFVAILTSIATAAALSLVLQTQATTTTMVQISEISSVTIFLPLVAGAVGALNLSQAENNSLVPGTVVGVLVAASLAPPAVLIGASAVLGRWDMVVSGGFLLILQLVAINISGALVFRYYQLAPHGSPIIHGKPKLFGISIGASVLLLAALLAQQFWSTPGFQRATRQQRATAVVQQVIREDPNVEMIETDLRFTRPSIEGQNKLLVIVYVQRSAQSNQTTEQIKNSLTSQIHQRLLNEPFNVVPLISVTVLEPVP